MTPYIGEVVVVEHVIAPVLVVEDEFLAVDAMIPLSVMEISILGHREARCSARRSDGG